jgi:protein TonB
MLKVAPVGGEQRVYRGPNEIDARQRLLALGAVAALHAAVIGGFIYAQLRPPPTPPEATLSVSFITETAASAAPAPTPPQPTPPPERQLMATPKPTPSPMTAPPPKPLAEPEPRREAPKAAQPAPASPPANAAPSAAASPSTRAAGDPGATTTTPPNFSAAYLNNPLPAYPPAAKFRGYQGTVELRVQVGADGRASQVLISRSSGHAELDDAARDVVKKRYRFVPAKQGDRAVVGWVIVPIEFSLTKSR